MWKLWFISRMEQHPIAPMLQSNTSSFACLRQIRFPSYGSLFACTLYRLIPFELFSVGIAKRQCLSMFTIPNLFFFIFWSSSSNRCLISGQMLSSHSIVPSSRTVRPWSPWGGRWIRHWRTTWSMVCSSAPHSQAAEETIPHLYRQERKCPTPVGR